MLEALIVGMIILAMVSGMIWCWHKEIGEWNGGNCPCGGDWEHFDNSSQGCRGYVCRSCKTYIWVTYPRVDRRKAA